MWKYEGIGRENSRNSFHQLLIRNSERNARELAQRVVCVVRSAGGGGREGGVGELESHVEALLRYGAEYPVRG